MRIFKFSDIWNLVLNSLLVSSWFEMPVDHSRCNGQNDKETCKQSLTCDQSAGESMLFQVVFAPWRNDVHEQ